MIETADLFTALGVVLLNGVATGFAVYLGNHTGQRVIDQFKKSGEREDMKTLETVKNIIIAKPVNAKDEQTKEIENNVDGV